MSLEQKEQMIVSAFKFAYFGHVKIGTSLWNELEEYCDRFCESKYANEQVRRELFLNLFQVVRRDDLTKYPVSTPHKRAVLNWIAENLNKNVDKIPSDLVDTLAELNTADMREPEYIFKTFDRGDSVYVTVLEENRDVNGHGTTGLISWQGALYLSDWVQNHRNKFQGKKVLELGSGVGMFGLSLLKTTNMKEYTFTDCHFQVLNFLRYNLKINFGHQIDNGYYREMQNCTSDGPEVFFEENKESQVVYRQSVSQPGGICDVIVKQLDWTKFNADDFSAVDLILGTDIVYSRNTLPALCDVITKLLEKGSDNSEAYIACTDRSRTTLECFEKSLNDAGLEFEIIQRGLYAPTDTIICADAIHKVIKIYKIRLR